MVCSAVDTAANSAARSPQPQCALEDRHSRLRMLIGRRDLTPRMAALCAPLLLSLSL